ncbi:hypothetical protein [Azospirillum palustre]
MTERKSHALDRDRRGNRAVTLRPPAARLNRQMGSPVGETPIARGMRLQGRRTGPYQISMQRFRKSRPAKPCLQGPNPAGFVQVDFVFGRAAGTGREAGTPPSPIASIWERFHREAASRRGTPRVPTP